MAKLYFSNLGSDTTGDGSQGNPYATFAKCVAVGATGDTFHAVGGTVDVPFTYDFTGASPLSLTGYSALTIEGDSPFTTKFDGAGANHTGPRWSSGIGAAVTVSNLGFTDAVVNAGASSPMINLFGGCNWLFDRCV